MHIYDTARREKVSFVPLEEGKVSLYVCGLTVYDLPHIGHARTFITFDIISRYLEWKGAEVTLIRNHTDIDDKIIRRAQEGGETPIALADRMIDGLNADMDALGVKRATVEPRVTTHIPEIIDLVERLIEKGHGYEVDGDVYFQVRTFDDYGKFSKRNLDELESGSRVQVDSRKRDPQDFALWKGAKPDEPSWESPWGLGRPGWHIECSAMSTKYLGHSFDIHGGGRDLIFPHHENEIAQSICANGGDFARHWMHVGMVEIDGEKMSHSLNNFWTVRDLLSQVHPEAMRFFFLTTHYRNNINFSRTTIQEATLRITGLYRTLEGLEMLLARKKGSEDLSLEGETLFGDKLAEVKPAFVAAMDDDFNTPRALAAIAQVEHLANEIVQRKGKLKEPRLRAAKVARALLLEIGGALGLLGAPTAGALSALRGLALKRLGLDAEKIEALVAARTTARKEKDWAKADEVRDQLVELGVKVLDRPEGTVWQVD